MKLNLGTMFIPGSNVKSVGNKRWIILSLLFFATALNYIDRQVIGLLKPTIAEELHWSEMDYANIVFYFQLAYSIGYVTVGRFMDVVGNKKGFFACVGVWSIACAVHGLVRTVSGFSAARFFLGLAEPGNFTGCLKGASMWFPKSERAFAIGIYNSGTNVGAMLAPFLIPWITIVWGWQWAFYITGGLGFIWLIAWALYYHNVNDYPGLTTEEKTYIQSDGPEPKVEKVPYSKILRLRTTWAFGIGNLMPMTIFWFYLFWLPDFLAKTHGIKLMELGFPLMAIYLAASVGSLIGGGISSSFIARGMKVLKARKIAMLISILFILPIMFAPSVSSLWGCTAIICVVVGSHQGWTANMWSLVTDSLPERVVGSVYGIAGFLGSVAGMGMAKTVGYVLQMTGSYYSLFLGIPAVYCISLLILHLFMPSEPEKI
ncbi:MAG: Hexuronate transporter [Firmicutes bacterium]|nr:Hexuronate transporter [Bacillota bacterium]